MGSSITNVVKEVKIQSGHTIHCIQRKYTVHLRGDAMLEQKRDDAMVCAASYSVYASHSGSQGAVEIMSREKASKRCSSGVYNICVD